ncbi:hypothetical protein DITRI_Ditri16bG0140400 [Diplodiscus trichospermus]
MDSNLAEILAIKEALSLFLASQWAQTTTLIVESDSSNVVKWLRESLTAPWRMRSNIHQIENLKNMLIGWSVQHILREGDSLADSLAKTGVHRVTQLLVIYA